MAAVMADGLKERENLYKLMISQLRYDGFEAIAATLAKVVNIISACPPMARLHQVVNLGIQAETEGVKPEQPVIPGLTPTVETNRGIDLEYEPEGNDVTGEWQTSTFMSNLELQKVEQESEGEPDEKPNYSPPANAVLHHILRISSDKKLVESPQDTKPIPESKPLTPNGDVFDAESICEQVKIELVKYNVSQEVFAKAVLGKSQGYLSEMLKHGESFFRPQDHTHYKGWLNFEAMQQFLLKPEAERLRIYYNKGEELKMERMKRRQIEIGLTDDQSKKKRRFIPTEAKAVMEDYYNRNNYLSIEKRQNLANDLAIPEQCVSDYFKNLRSRKKHEEHMKCLLKGLESADKQLDKVDSEAAESGIENSMNNQLPSCSRNLLIIPTTSAVESTLHVQPSKLIKQCGRRYNVAPAATMSTFQASPAKTVSETDLVASKIAALTQSQKSPHKESRNAQGSPKTIADVLQHETVVPATVSGHHVVQEGSRHETNCLLPRASSSGADAEEPFSLDNLFNGSMMELQDHGTSPPAAMYETYYVTAHKGPCRTASFSQNGRLISTGSADASIKVLDVERMVAKNTMPQSQDQGAGTNLENHPVIRTLYDHTEEVTALEFHPTALVLASGSKDCTIKLFDISKPSVKKAYRSIQEAEVVTSMSFHPTGDFLLVGTEHPTIRLYDTNTGQCFVPSNPREYHTAAIAMVKYSPSANLYASCSKDGSIKIWDGVSNKCIQTFPQAHNGNEVYSVCFSQNSKYIVSSGKDSLVLLWELATGRALNMYTGATMSNYRTQIVFNHTEDFMIVADESNNSIACWDTRTTEKQKLLTSGHNNHIRCITHSPTSAAFVSCSDDFRARFWYCQGV